MTRLAFAPVIPVELLVVLAVAAALVTIYAFYMRARGAWARGLAFAVLLFALTGPLLVREKHAPLPDVAVIVTDRSQSMNLGKRSSQAEAARATIRRLLAQQPDLIVRETSVTTTATGENNGTQAFAALNAALADVPPGRVAGAVLITDGQVHDAPPPQTMSLKAPLQVLVAGGRKERDRKLTVLNAARFAIVGQWTTMRLRVDDLGGSGETSAQLDIRIDGKPFGSRSVPVGKDPDIKVPVAHEGENLIELSAAPGPAELTLQNNHAVVTVSGESLLPEPAASSTLNSTLPARSKISSTTKAQRQPLERGGGGGGYIIGGAGGGGGAGGAEGGGENERTGSSGGA